MTGRVRRLFGWLAIGLVVALAAAPSSAYRQETQLSVSAATASLTAAGNLATAKFVVQATAGDEAAVSGITVVFSETYSVALGDAAAGATVKSEPQQITVDMAGVPTKSVHMPVTVKYTVDGVAVSRAAVLHFGVIQ